MIREREEWRIGVVVGDRVDDELSYVCAGPADGSVRLRFSLATSREALGMCFGKRPRSLVAVAGRHCRWVRRLISECGHRVVRAAALPAEAPADPLSAAEELMLTLLPDTPLRKRGVSLQFGMPMWLPDKPGSKPKGD
jgi:hypothetical protein